MLHVSILKNYNQALKYDFKTYLKRIHIFNICAISQMFTNFQKVVRSIEVCIFYIYLVYLLVM
jgi:hypothetical protein